MTIVWLGAVLGVVASMTGTAGKQLLRFSHVQGLRGTVGATFLSYLSLIGGLALNVIVGPAVDMGSYAFAPQSIIAPLGGLDIVWNTLTAPCTLGENLTPSLLLGCTLIAGGATTTFMFGSHVEEPVTLESLKATLLRWTVLLYLLCLLLWLLFNILVLMPRSTAPKGEPFKTGDRLRGLSLGMTAGSLAGNMFCVKALVKLIQATVEDRSKAEYWLDWLPYALLLGAVFFAVSNLFFLAKAMREYEALFMGAVFEGSLITSGCLSGVVVFSEVEGLDLWKVGLYCLAVIVIVVGVGTVSIACMRQRQGRAEDDTVVQDGMMESAAESGDNDGCLETGDIEHRGIPSRGDTADLERHRQMSRVFSRASLKSSISTHSGPFREVPLAVLELSDTFSRRSMVVHPEEITCPTSVPNSPAPPAVTTVPASKVTTRVPAHQPSSAQPTSLTQNDRTPSPEARPVSNHQLQAVSAVLQ